MSAPDQAAALAGAVGVLGVIIGWGLKTVGARWAWHRDRVLEAYLEVLEAADRFDVSCAYTWASGARERSAKWRELANQTYLNLAKLGHANRKLELLADRSAAVLTVKLYYAGDRMYRRATAEPPSSKSSYEEAMVEMGDIYAELVDAGRRELQTWRWREPSGETLRALSARLKAELRQSDPIPPPDSDDRRSDRREPSAEVPQAPPPAS